jgi:hypothetical protein
MERKRTYDDVAATVQVAKPETLNDGDESATPLSEAELKKEWAKGLTEAVEEGIRSQNYRRGQPNTIL